MENLIFLLRDLQFRSFFSGFESLKIRHQNGMNVVILWFNAKRYSFLNWNSSVESKGKHIRRIPAPMKGMRNLLSESDYSN